MEESIVFETENGTRSNKVSRSDLEAYLKQINGSSNSYARLEKDDGSYMQVGGGPSKFTVAKVKNSISSGIIKIMISDSLVDVQTNQVLNLKTVIDLFILFLKGDVFPEIVEWDDITSMFK